MDSGRGGQLKNITNVCRHVVFANSDMNAVTSFPKRIRLTCWKDVLCWNLENPTSKDNWNASLVPEDYYDKVPSRALLQWSKHSQLLWQLLLGKLANSPV